MTDFTAQRTRRLKISGVVISLGLVVEAATLFSLKALSFLVFAGLGSLLVGVGVLFFLYGILFK